MLSHVCVYEMLLNSEIVLQNAQLQVGRVGLQMWARGEERERERVKVQSSYYLNWNCFTKKLIQELRCLCLLKFIISFNLLLSAMCLWYGKVMRIRFSKLNTPTAATLLFSLPTPPTTKPHNTEAFNKHKTIHFQFQLLMQNTFAMKQKQQIKYLFHFQYKPLVSPPSPPSSHWHNALMRKTGKLSRNAHQLILESNNGEQKTSEETSLYPLLPSYTASSVR